MEPSNDEGTIRPSDWTDINRATVLEAGREKVWMSFGRLESQRGVATCTDKHPGLHGELFFFFLIFPFWSLSRFFFRLSRWPEILCSSIQYGMEMIGTRGWKEELWRRGRGMEEPRIRCGGERNTEVTEIRMIQYTQQRRKASECERSTVRRIGRVPPGELPYRTSV